MKVDKLVVSLIGGLVAIALNVSVWAQNSGALEEIVVTAQKRSESLQEVPISIKDWSLIGIAADLYFVFSGFPNTLEIARMRESITGAFSKLKASQ